MLYLIQRPRQSKWCNKHYQQYSERKGSYWKRDLYNYQKNRLNPNISWETKWVKVLQKREKDIDWEKIWQTLHNSKVSYKIQSTHWSQMNRSYLTNYSINKSNPLHPSICTYCNQIQTEQHHKLYCITAEKVWEHFEEILSKLSDKPFNLGKKYLG